MAVADTNCTIVALNLIPMVTPGGITGVGVAPVVTLTMAMPALKDLSIVVGDAITQYENKFGIIETAFMKGRPAT